MVKMCENLLDACWKSRTASVLLRCDSVEQSSLTVQTDMLPKDNRDPPGY